MSQDILQQAREAFAYDSETGAITRRSDTRNGRMAGESACSRSRTGYLTVSMRSRNFYAHRVAWLLAHGEWPAVIDHINGDKTDNRLCNLRNVSNQVNSQNKTRAYASSATGVLGVHFDKKKRKFVASITNDGRSKFLGHHDTPEAAHVAYVHAKRATHEGCTL